MLVFSLWGAALLWDGRVTSAYLILGVIVFSLSFPGTSQIRVSVWRMLFNIFFSWTWMAGLLLLIGFLTGYTEAFSAKAIGH